MYSNILYGNRRFSVRFGSKLLLEAGIHCPEVGGELLGEAHCEGFAGREIPLGLRKVDL